ncbi:autotransporter outer membrane beta-barrel domain-containing protein [Flagellatimonas centrodinii]|uniref:autotransporter outer membrane beta-barrel domain-containing protein n=1 Tax=Flagellatimonas centrodinii TaxID=2806210 RepID=UPI001FED344B|nr:autotransporter outer membrane beta-barrel domain-containing protein [Flagellatimonas centrodinii]ULQ47666.1 autotransporter outer membrane beta-barrel domain-containing protein [Flagellatimonas centrodinii]
MQGTNFIAGPNSRIALDAALAELAQPDCTTAEAADCVDFTGGTTSGTTLLTLSDARPAVSSAAFNEGMVIIQGASAAEHFVLDPNSRGYVANTSTGPAIQKGLVTYRFTYDEAAKQHTLTGVLADEGAQGGTFMALAQEVWRTTGDTWFDRQAQLRSSSGVGEGTAGLWSTLNVNRGERDLMRTVNIGGNAYDYNLQQDIAITHLAFGGDILRGTTDAGAWNFGGTAGYVFSTVDYDATKLELEVGGFAAGFYGSYLAGPLSVDGLLNYTLATQSLESTNMGLGPDTRLRSDYSTLGARVDVAWKLALGEALYLQPLASVSKSSTDADDMEVPNDGGSFQFDGDSTRLGVGFRTGLQSRVLGLKSGVDLTARWWNESDAENETVVTIPNGNTQTPLVDDFSGDFTELALGLNLSNDSGAFSGFINLKSQMADDYDMLGASAGFRFQW